MWSQVSGNRVQKEELILWEQGRRCRQGTMSCFRVWDFCDILGEGPRVGIWRDWFGAQGRNGLEIEILESSINRRSLKTGVRIKSSRENVFRMRRGPWTEFWGTQEFGSR